MFPDMETKFWSGIPWLNVQLAGGCQRHTPATMHKYFHKEPGCMLSRGLQSMCRRLWHTPKISQKFAGEWNLVCCATAGTKTALGIIQLWFNYFASFVFKAPGNLNVNYFKIPKTHRGPQKRPACVWDPWSKTFMWSVGHKCVQLRCFLPLQHYLDNIWHGKSLRVIQIFT